MKQDELAFLKGNHLSSVLFLPNVDCCPKPPATAGAEGLSTAAAAGMIAGGSAAYQGGLRIEQVAYAGLQCDAFVPK